MFEFIFTIGCFDKLHKGHIKLLNSMKEQCKKLIIGIHDNDSIQKIKNITDIDPLDNRKKNIEKYAFDIFVINNIDPTNAIKEYISKNFLNLEPIIIGPSKKKNKTILNVSYSGDLFFIHDYPDKFKYLLKGNNIIVTRTDKKRGWGQNLIGYKKNWCFMRGDDNKNFPSIDYIKSIMPIKYLKYTSDISASDLRDYKNKKVGLMNYLLQKVVKILNDNNIPYHLDCGTLLGCIRENGLMKKDSDIDVTTHLSLWDKLNAIDFGKYDLIRTRTYKGYPEKSSGNMISVKTKFSNIYCDIYTNPAFPQLDNIVLNGNNYSIPINSDLYLTQLYGNWRVPSKRHASTIYHRGNGLVKSEYSKHWNKNYKIFECNM